MFHNYESIFIVCPRTKNVSSYMNLSHQSVNLLFFFICIVDDIYKSTLDSICTFRNAADIFTFSKITAISVLLVKPSSAQFAYHNLICSRDERLFIFSAGQRQWEILSNSNRMNNYFRKKKQVFKICTISFFTTLPIYNWIKKYLHKHRMYLLTYIYV